MLRTNRQTDNRRHRTNRVGVDNHVPAKCTLLRRSAILDHIITLADLKLDMRFLLSQLVSFQTTRCFAAA